MRVVVPEPRKVDDGRDALVLAQQHTIPCAVAVLAGVELDDVRSRRLTFADEDRDAQHRVGYVEKLARPPRRLLREDEAHEVGARFDGGIDILLARQAAYFHERTRQERAQLRGGI